MRKRTVGMWIYKNAGGKSIENKIKKKLKERDIESICSMDLNNAIVKNGSIYCNVKGRCNYNIQENIDLFFSYNSGEQTSYQLSLYQAIDRLIPTINNYNSFILTENKFQTSFLLRNNGIPTADYEFCHSENNMHLEYILKQWSQKICKPLDGWGGKDLTKLDEKTNIYELTKLLNDLSLNNVYIEKFIDYDNTDYRIDIVDGKFVSCYGRQAPKDEWKTNITNGGNIFLREANDEIISLAIKATLITGLEIAGVDILYDREKEQYIVLEVNGIPAFATPQQESKGLSFNDIKIDLIVDMIDRETANL